MNKKLNLYSEEFYMKGENALVFLLNNGVFDLHIQPIDEIANLDSDELQAVVRSLGGLIEIAMAELATRL